jgi:isopenicillin N synthase-like dioxygenase
VRPSTTEGRLSYPFFFDPGWDAEVRPVPVRSGEPLPPAPDRWDGVDLTKLSGTYGAYLMSKVAKVFPELSDEVLP